MSEYDDDTKVDKYALDEEAELQPARYKKWSDKVAEATLKRDQCASRLELIEARLSKKARRQLENELGKRPTEDMVKTEIRLDEERQKVVEELHQLEYEINIYKGARTAMDHKKSAIDVLTRLHIASYFSKPVVPKDSEYRAQTKRREVDSAKITEQIKARKRRNSED